MTIIRPLLLGHERHRRRRHHVGDGGELLRSSLGQRDEAGDDLGGRRKHQHAPHHRADVVQAVLEAGRDAEVAAAAADRPEQVRVVLGVDAEQLAVRGHDLGGQQVVDREAVFADEVAHATAKRDPADPDRAGVAEPGREAVGIGRDRVRGRGQARLGPCGPALHVDLERLHVPEVEHDPAVGRAVPGVAVAAAADGELRSALASERDDSRDIVGIRDPHDRRRALVRPAVEGRSRRVVRGVVRTDDATGNVRQRQRGDHFGHLSSGSRGVRRGARGSATSPSAPAPRSSPSPPRA